jgi:hypothetical protein
MTLAPWSAHQRAAATLAEVSRTPVVVGDDGVEELPAGGMRQGATMQPCAEVISSAAGVVGAEGLFGDHGGAQVGADGGGGAAVEEPDEDVAAVPGVDAGLEVGPHERHGGGDGDGGVAGFGVELDVPAVRRLPEAVGFVVGELDPVGDGGPDRQGVAVVLGSSAAPMML